MQIDYDKCDKIIAKIRNKFWLQKNKITTEELLSYGRVQVRETDDPQHILDIKDLIEEAKSTVNTDPVVVAEFKELLEYLRKIWNGNHTTRATDVARIDDKSLQWQLIPKEVTDTLNELEIAYIGNALNPKKKKREKETAINDCVKMVLSLLRLGNDINSDEVNTLIKKLGHVGGAIKSIKSRARTRIGKELSVKEGHIWKQYKTVYKSELTKIKKKLKKPTNEVLDMSSAFFKESSLTALAMPWSKRIDKGKKQIKKEIVVVTTHTDILEQEKWDSTNKDIWIPQATYVLHKMNGIKLTVYELHPWAPDGTTTKKCSCCPTNILKDVSHKLT